MEKLFDNAHKISGSLSDEINKLSKTKRRVACTMSFILLSFCAFMELFAFKALGGFELFELASSEITANHLIVIIPLLLAVFSTTLAIVAFTYIFKKPMEFAGLFASTMIYGIVWLLISPIIGLFFWICEPFIAAMTIGFICGSLGSIMCGLFWGFIFEFDLL